MATEKPLDGRRRRWDKHNQERRQLILDAAIAEIDTTEPGTEVHVQAIADRAGLGRTVVYRHFEDRTDLDRAVQQAIFDDLWSRLLPGIRLDGTITEIIERIIATYVSWAAAHPALHRFAEAGSTGDGSSTLRQGLDVIAEQVHVVIESAIELLGAEPSQDQRDSLDPLVHGLVAAVNGAVSRWMARPQRTPPAPVVVGLMTHSVWLLIDGHARSLGLELDPHVPVEEILGLHA